MTFPVVTIRRSALLTGQTNGKLTDSILVNIPGLAGGPTIRLITPAARSWKAMQAHARVDGHVLKATSASDSFRPYSVQESIFRQRYTTTVLAGRPSRVWNGVRWYQKPNTAAAAVPGTSNHGWACAVDTGTELDGDAGTEAIDKATLDWLLKHAADYGWSWELQSEPWHLHYFAGDTIPAAVLAFEHSAPPIPEDDMIDPYQRIVEVPTTDKPPFVITDAGGKVLGKASETLDVVLLASHDGKVTPLIVQWFRSDAGNLWTDAVGIAFAKLDGTPAPPGAQARVQIIRKG